MINRLNHFEWIIKVSQAILFDNKGNKIGQHYIVCLCLQKRSRAGCGYVFGFSPVRALLIAINSCLALKSGMRMIWGM